MHSDNKKINLFRTAAKLASALVVLVLVFSPFMQVFQTPVVQAVQPGQSGAVTGAAAVKLVEGQDIGCGSGGINLDLCISDVVYVFTVGLGSGIAYIAAKFFSLAVKLALQGEVYALTFISDGWTVVRDLANMSFIFILLYLAFTIMLQAETRKTMGILAGVVVVAMLVNFSFFLTRLVVDVGNITAVQFYNLIDAPLVADATQNPDSRTTRLAADYLGPSGETKDLTASIMGGIQIQNALNTNSFSKYSQSFSGGTSKFLSRLIAMSFLYICVGAILFMLAAAFFTAAVQFVVRVVALWFAIIVSPLALVARTMKQTEKYFDDWRDMLIKNSIYPAVFLFVFWILTLFTKAMSQCAGGGAGEDCSIASNIFTNLAAQPGGEGWFTGLVTIITTIGIRLGFVIALLYFAFKASDKVGAWGASAAKGFAGWGIGFPAKWASRGVGFAGRQTVGRGGRALASSPIIADLASKTGWKNTPARWTGKLFEKAGKGLGGASFDPRNAPGATRVKTLTDKLTGLSIDAGKAEGVGGYAKSSKEASERHERERAERAAIMRDAANKEAIKRIVENTYVGGATDPQKKLDEDRAKNLSKREIEKLSVKNLGAIAALLSESQHKTVQDSDKYTDQEKEEVRTLWHDKNNAAPLQKAQKIIDELRNINAKLTIPTSKVASIDHHTTAGSLLDSTAVSTMLADTNTQIAELRSDIKKAAPGVSTANLQKDLIQLTNATKSLEKLNEERGKVPPKVGGTSSSGEFVVK